MNDALNSRSCIFKHATNRAFPSFWYVHTHTGNGSGSAGFDAISSGFNENSISQNTYSRVERSPVHVKYLKNTPYDDVAKMYGGLSTGALGVPPFAGRNRIAPPSPLRAELTHTCGNFLLFFPHRPGCFAPNWSINRIRFKFRPPRVWNEPLQFVQFVSGVTF